MSFSPCNCCACITITPICLQCDHHESVVGEIFVSLPWPSTVQEYNLDFAMDQRCMKGVGVYCRQEGGMGPHLINLYCHVKYKSADDQVRSISSMCRL